MSTSKPPSRTAPQFVVRLPDLEFREELARAAAANNRSMNAEIVARLQSSFDSSLQLPFAVEQAIEDYMDAKGGTPEEALTHLVLAGQASGSMVLNVTINPGATYQQFRELLQAAEGLVPEDATIVMNTKFVSVARQKRKQ